MNIKAIFTLIASLGIVYFLYPIISYAQTTCTPIYGGGQTCVIAENVLVDKKILNPQTNILVDNLGVNDAKLNPEDLVTFQITVTNKNDTEIKKIDVKDVFPQHVTFSSGTGNFDANTKNLTFSIDNLKPSEARMFTVVGRVASASEISMEQGVVCVVNQVTATNTADNSTSSDNTQFCIEKKVETKGGFPVLTPPTVTVTPPTGADSLVLFSLLPTGIAGWLIRKYSSY
ncbi:DUF11 domain-containing protein [Candidatus Roizmanbacteria bacterium]|nr:DUF11 domain-containing protein [Candidatus Roizmanbacteria bacterium]